MNKDYITGIVTHENQKIFNGFKSVSEYISYRNTAVGIINTVAQMMRTPFALQKVAEIIQGDSLYILTSHVSPFEGNNFGETVAQYLTDTTELELETAFKLSGGAIKWDKHEKDGVIYYFMYVDPTDIKAKWKWINDTLSRLVDQETKKETPPEAMLPDEFKPKTEDEDNDDDERVLN